MGIALLVVCLLLIWRHRSNIRNLVNGTESRIGSKKDSQKKVHS
jgi:glycerol-3-phosphate acyltransferase PlsY